MPDVQLPDTRESGDRLHVVIRQGVAGIELHAGLHDHGPRFAHTLDLGTHLGVAVGPAMSMKAIRVRTGMDLACIETTRRGSLDLARLGVDECTGPYPGTTQLPHHLGQVRPLAGDIEPALGGDLLPALGHQRHHRRSGTQSDRDHLRGRGHLQVEPDLHDAAHLLDVPVLDVPAVLAQMDRHGVRAAELGLDGRPHRVGLPRPAGLPDRGHMVDVHAQLNHANSIRADGVVYCAVVSSFQNKLDRLRSDLVTQGRRVNELMLRAVESFFDRDASKAGSVVQGDDVIDKVNVEIERAAVPLLAMGITDEHDIRWVLTIVKINNELERVADCGVNIAETVKGFGAYSEQIPPTFRVMANSVVGMMRDANRALEELNTDLAQQVLAFDDTVDRFKREIILDAEEKVAGGDFNTQFAFGLLDVTKNLERIADHCTNICEQVIYVESGLVVRHMPEGWSKPHRPEDVA